jgi:hypothetical protein
LIGQQPNSPQARRRTAQARTLGRPFLASYNTLPLSRGKMCERKLVDEREGHRRQSDNSVAKAKHKTCFVSSTTRAACTSCILEARLTACSVLHAVTRLCGSSTSRCCSRIGGREKQTESPRKHTRRYDCITGEQ